MWHDHHIYLAILKFPNQLHHKDRHQKSEQHNYNRLRSIQISRMKVWFFTGLVFSESVSSESFVSVSESSGGGVLEIDFSVFLV